MTAFTRAGREQWRVDLDRQGLVTSPWAEKFATGSLLSGFDKYSPHIGEFDWKRDLLSLEIRTIWAAAFELVEEGMQVDVVAIVQRMTENGTLTDLPDGAQYLIILLDQTEDLGSVHHFAEWLGIITRAAAMRRFLSGLRSIVTAAGDEQNLESLRTAVARLADDLPPERNRRESTMQEAVEELLTTLEAGTSETIKATILEIDHATKGFSGGELIVIGARPSHGKTLLALQMLDHAAEQGHPGLMLSEEMSRSSLARRTLSRITCLDAGDWTTDMNRVRFDVRQHFLERAPVIVRESCGTVDIAERAIAQAVRKHGVKFVAVDYAQLLKGSGANRYEQVSDVSVRMKRAATRYGIVVFLLAQLSREIEKRPDPTPTLADLKDSGQLEQDADVVLFPFWPIKINPRHADPYEYRIYQAKNRNRGVSTPIIQMRIDPNRQRIEGPYDRTARDFR